MFQIKHTKFFSFLRLSAVITWLCVFLQAGSVESSYFPTVGSNIGIGTSTPVGGMVVMNGNVGIGTWSPTARLQIVGTVSATSFVGDGSGLTGISANSGWTDDGTNVYNSTTSDNVGIGTTTPSTTLEIVKQSSNAPLMVSSTPTGDGDYLLVTSSGRIGIGTALPGMQVEIKGSGNALGDLGAAFISTNALGWVNNRFRNDAGVDAFIGMGGSSTSTGYASRFYMSSQGGLSLIAEGAGLSDIRFYVGGPLAVNERARFDINGNLGIGTTTPVGGVTVMNGNVGVGTWSPTARLQVVGTVSATSFVGDGSGLTGISANSGWTDGGTNVYNSTTSDNVGIGTTTPSTTFEIVKQSSSAPLMISSTPVGDGDMLLITSSGNLGIGSTAPAGRLTVSSAGGVNSGINLNMTSVASYGTIDFNTPSGLSGQFLSTGASYSNGIFNGDQIALASYINGGKTTLVAGGTGSYINFATGGFALANERMRIDSSGNVGIGTTFPVGALTVMNGNVGIGTWSPTQRLQVVGTVSATSFVGDGSGLTGISANSGWSDGGTNVYNSTTTDNVAIGTTTPNGKFVVMGGNVGIGTTTPVGGLTVMNGNMGIGTWSPNDALIVMNGNVGIGTVLPGASLDSNGGIRGTNFAVRGTVASGVNASALGSALASGTLTSSNSGSFAGGFVVSAGGTASILSSGAGSFAFGNVLGSPGVSSLTASNSGAVAMGYVSVGSLTSSGLGAIAMGYASSSGTLQASGQASVALGENVEATANNAFSLGKGFVNSTASTFKVGFTATPALTVTAANVGIGTIDPFGSLIVANGNVGIGTVRPVGGLTVMSGNVGIGTWSPTSLLQVVGTVSATSFVGDGSGLTGISANSGWSDGGTNVYTSTSTDNVGIGTTTPTATLLIENISTSDSLRVNDALLDNSPFVINSAGNVGIGTTGPTAQLHVYEAGGNNVTIKAQSVGNSTNLWLDSFGGNDWTVENNNGTFRIYESGVQNQPYMQFEAGLANGSAIPLYIQSSGNVGIGTETHAAGLAVMNGNVGIGTWSPTAKLQVVGTVSATAFVGDGSGLTGISANSGWTDGGTNVYNSTTTDNVAIGTTTPNGKLVVMGGNVGIGTTTPVGGLTVMNGNVGIGTWSPSNALEVAGGNIGIGTTYAIVTTGTTDSLLTMRSDATSSYFGYKAGNSIVLGSRHNTVLGSEALFLSDSAQNSVAVGDQALYSTSSGVSNIAVGRQALYNNISGSSNIALGTQALIFLNGSSNIAIGSDAGRNTVFLGNVLASTQSIFLGENTKPLASGNTNEIIIGYAAEGNGSNTVTLGNSSVITTVLQGNVGVGTYNSKSKMTVNGGVGIGTTDSSVFINTAAPSGGLIVENNVGVGTTRPVGALAVMNGNVGIGTWSPTARLQVVGSVMATSFVGDGSGLTGISAGTTGWTDGGTNVYTTTTTDNVAIGTTTPASTLTVRGSVGIGTTTPYRSTAAPANGMIVEGNVGIGTWSPTAKLELIGGNLRMDNGATIEFGGGSLAGWTGLYGDDGSFVSMQTNGAKRLTANYGGSIDFGNEGNTTLMSVQPDGNVGIGTVDPLGALTVLNGNVGIGTMNPVNRLAISGNIGIGTTLPYRRIPAPNNGMVVEGNVGIGTWNPTAKLQVTGEVLVSSGDIRVDDATGNKGLVVRESVGVTDVFRATAGGTVSINGTNNFPTNTMLNITQNSGTSGNFIELNSTGSTNGNRFVVLSGGNIGVGTTRPVGALTVMNGNVGIGTWSPTARLQVVGTVSASSFVGDGSGLTGIAAGGWTDGGTNVYTSTTTDNVAIGTTTPTATLLIENAGTQNSLRVNDQVLDGSPFVIDAAGNVGIGTTTPSYPLDVKFSAAGLDLVRFQNTSASGYSDNVFVDDGGTMRGSFGYANTGAPDVNLRGKNFFWIGSSDFMLTNTAVEDLLTVKNSGNVGIGTSLQSGAFVVMNGNVGIGTWSPTARLQVVGTLNVADPTTVDGLSVGSGNSIISNSTVAVGINNTATGNTNAMAVGIANTSYGIVLGRTSSALNSTSVAVGDSVINTIPNSLQIGPSDAAKMMIDASGNVGLGTIEPKGKLIVLGGNVGIGTIAPVGALTVMNGNVGIGTWSPTAKLQVVGSVLATSFVGDGSGLTGIAGGSTGWTDGGTNVYVTTTTDNVSIGTTTPAALLFVENAGTTDSFRVNDSVLDGSAFIIDSAGNVGIGTSSVDGAARLQVGSFAGSTTAGIYIKNTSGNSSIRFDSGSANYGLGIDQSDSNKFKISKASNIVSGDDFVITTAGNVGIGTGSPVGALTVMNGNVGIGTWSPTQRLQVVGSAQILGESSAVATGIASIRSSGTHAPLLFMIASSIQGGMRAEPSEGMAISYDWDADGGGDLNFMTGEGVVAVNRMTLSAVGRLGIGTTTPLGGLVVMNGNAGIGTWSPTAKLQVVGSVLATSFVGDGSGLTGISAGSTGWTDGGTNVYTTATTDNVGIGTTTPSTTLEIVKQSTNSPLMVSSTATGDGDYFIVNSAGNLGIGTVSALNAKLTVNGGITSLGTSAGSIILSEAAAGGTNTITVSAPSTLAADRSCTLEDDSTPFDSCVTAGSSGWTDGGTNVFTSTTTDNVAIGTTTPIHTLTVAGNIGIGTTAAYRTIAGPRNGFVAEGNVGIGTWRPDAQLEIAKLGAQTPLMVSSTGSGNGDYLVVLSDGRVGIGTTSPGDRIEAVNSLDANVFFTFANYTAGTSASSGVQVRSNSASGYLTAASSSYVLQHLADRVGFGSGLDASGLDVYSPNQDIHFLVGDISLASSIRMAVDSAGNVGIGTSSSSNTLGVIGSVGIGTTTPYRRITGPANGLIAEGNVGIGTWAAGNGKMIVMGGNVGIGTTTPVGAFTVMNGNVGIGTWSPTAMLQVVGSVLATSFVGDGSGLTGISAGGWTDGGTNVFTSTTTDNVAIGTTTPASTLTVRGSVGIGTTTPYRTIAAPANGMIIEGNVGIGTWAAANGKLVVMGGNVGVGTVTPQAPMHIYSATSQKWLKIGNVPNPTTGAGAGGIVIDVNDAAGSGVFMSDSVNGLYGKYEIYNGALGIGAISNHPVQFFSNDIVRMSISPGGNVGIGTTVASSLLTIIGGNVGIGTTTPYRVIRGPSNGMAVEGNIGIGTWAAGNGKMIVMGGNVGIGTTTPVGAFTVMNGNVGIGTWSPVNKLQVKGSFSSAAVTLTDAATIATDASLGNLFRVTLGGNRTLGNPTNPVDGQKVTWELIQDGSGNRTITLDTKFALGTDISSVTLTTTATKRDFLGAIYNATEDKWYVVSFVKGY